MQIKIKQSFAEVGFAPFRAGEVITVPDELARQWIVLKRAEPLQETKPKPRETAAIKPRRERR